MGISREERRRRIMEGGSDRLALITGQLQNIDPSSPLALSAFHQRAYSESFMPRMVSEDHLTQEIAAAKYQFNEKATTAEEPKLPAVPQIPPKISERKPETRRGHHVNIFSSKKLNSSIINSEGTRSLCSLIIASLGVLSYVDYPLIGMNFISSDSIVALRPVYVLLLTDCTIVLAHLFMEASGEGGRDAEEDGGDVSGRGAGETWAGAEKLLERGLVAYQAFRGIFVDCSLYMVVVICGLSLL